MNRRTRGESRDLPPREQTYRAGKQRNLHLAGPWGETAQKRYLHALPSVFSRVCSFGGPSYRSVPWECSLPRSCNRINPSTTCVRVTHHRILGSRGLLVPLVVSKGGTVPGSPVAVKGSQVLRRTRDWEGSEIMHTHTPQFHTNTEHMHTHRHNHRHTHMHSHPCAHSQTCQHIPTHLHIHTDTHSYTSTYDRYTASLLHAHTHTHTHTQRQEHKHVKPNYVEYSF